MTGCEVLRHVLDVRVIVWFTMICFSLNRPKLGVTYEYGGIHQNRSASGRTAWLAMFSSNIGAVLATEHVPPFFRTPPRPASGQQVILHYRSMLIPIHHHALELGIEYAQWLMAH